MARVSEQDLGSETVTNILEPDCPALDEVVRLVRDFAVEVTVRSQYMRDEMFGDLRRHFTEAQIVELTLRTALCGFFNRFNDALMIGMEDGVVADMLTVGASETDLPSAAAE